MTNDEYRSLTREFLNDSLTPDRNINEQLDMETEDMPRRFEDDLWSENITLRDEDDGGSIPTTVTADNGMVTVELGGNMTLHLSALDAADLGEILLRASNELDRSSRS